MTLRVYGFKFEDGPRIARAARPLAHSYPDFVAHGMEMIFSQVEDRQVFAIETFLHSQGCRIIIEP